MKNQDERKYNELLAKYHALVAMNKGWYNLYIDAKAEVQKYNELTKAVLDKMSEMADYADKLIKRGEDKKASIIQAVILQIAEVIQVKVESEEE